MGYCCIFDLIVNKYSFKLLLSLVFISLLNLQLRAKTYTVARDETILDGSDNYDFVVPGDTLLIHGQPEYLLIKNFIGSIAKPIVVTNVPNEVFAINTNYRYGISIRGVKYFKLVGQDVNGGKGIRIANGLGYGMDIGYLSTNYTIDGLDIGPTFDGPGILAKTDPTCTFESIRANFVQDSSIFINNYIHDTDSEGFYIGYTFYQGVVKNCGGKDTLLLPHLLNNTRVSNNVLERTGWDGIQLSSTHNSLVYDNVVLNDSQKKLEYQMNGIILGEGFSGIVRNNLIKDGEGTGMFVKGHRDIIIANNIIINPGKNNANASGKYGIYVDFKDNQSNLIRIDHNLIANPKYEAIRYIGNEGTDAMISNNFMFYNTEFYGDADVLINTEFGNDVALNNNLKSTESVALNSYLLTDSLDVVANALGKNAGNAQSTVLDYDYYYRPRDVKPDVGPFESQITSGVGNENEISCTLNFGDSVDVYSISFQKVLNSVVYSRKMGVVPGVYFLYSIEHNCLTKIYLN